MTASKPDILTLAGMAAVVFTFTTLMHEGLGHGGACLAVGAQPVAWGAYYFDCDTHAGPPWKWQAVAAAGSTVNLILCVLSYVALKAALANGKRGLTALLLWLLFALDGFTWAGYFLFSGIGGIGDWGTGSHNVLDGVPNAMMWRIAMAAGGGLAYVLIGRAAGRLLGQITGEDRKAGRRIATTFYLAGGTVSVLIGLLNPVGLFVLLASAAASSFGGASGMLWLPRFIKGGNDGSYTAPRNWLWVIVGVAATAAYALILGPTVKL
ncbi:MAG: hypothetical protein JF615_12745 [Asticcacaulis sp.]|nr:hypothetical protein [Asticcacaulis sp.]